MKAQNKCSYFYCLVLIQKVFFYNAASVLVSLRDCQDNFEWGTQTRQIYIVVTFVSLEPLKTAKRFIEKAKIFSSLKLRLTNTVITN